MGSILNTRVPKGLYKNLLKKTFKNWETISEYARRVFTKSFEKDVTNKANNIANDSTDPLINKEMLGLILWMYSKRYSYTDEHNIEETEYYFCILKKYLFRLDNEYLLLFSKLYSDLERVISNHKPFRDIYYYFSSDFKSERFDFEKFEDLIFKEVGA